MNNYFNDLTQALRNISCTTTGYSYRVARVLATWLASDRKPDYVARNMIADILNELEVQWDRVEDALDWPDDEDEEDEEDER